MKLKKKQTLKVQN